MRWALVGLLMVVALAIALAFALPQGPSEAAGNELIAFESWRGGNWDVYTIRPDGSGLTRLTDDPADDGSPAWLCGGHGIIFEADRVAGNYDLYRLDLGGTPIRLTTDPGFDALATTSCGFTGVVFESNRDGNWEVYKRPSNESGDIELTNVDAFSGEPALSPDGAKIAFSAAIGGSSWDIYTMDLNGYNVTRLTDAPDNDSEPNWSPDGSQIVFTSQRDGNQEVYLMNADGSNQHRLTTNPDVDRLATFSPDGNKIAFTSYRGNYDVYIMNTDGSDPVDITNDPDDIDRAPAWVKVSDVPDTPTPTGAASATPTRTPTRTASPVPSATRAPPTLSGDANCDGHVNAVDALAVLQLSAGLIGTLPCGDAADVNHDGRVGALDAALILQYSAGLLHALPA